MWYKVISSTKKREVFKECFHSFNVTVRSRVATSCRKSSNLPVADSRPWKYKQLTPVFESPRKSCWKSWKNHWIYLRCYRKFLPYLTSYRYYYSDIARMCNNSGVYFSLVTCCHFPNSLLKHSFCKIPEIRYYCTGKVLKKSSQSLKIREKPLNSAVTKEWQPCKESKSSKSPKYLYGSSFHLVFQGLGPAVSQSSNSVYGRPFSRWN